jgi:ATP-binding cassette, subfamily C, bacterial
VKTRKSYKTGKNVSRFSCPDRPPRENVLMKFNRQKEIIDAVITVVRLYPKRTAMIMSGLVLAGLAEGTGVSSMLPMLNLATGGSSSDSRLEQMFLSLMELIGVSPTFGNVLVILAIVMTLKGLFMMFAMGMAGIAVAQTSAELRTGLLQKLMNAKWSFFLSQPIGIFSNAMGVEADKAATMIRQTAMIAALSVQITVYLSAATLTNWKVAGGAMVAGIVLFVVLNGLVEFARRAGQDSLTASRALLSRLADAMQGIKPMKAMATEDRLSPLMASEIEELRRATRNSILSRETLVHAQEPIIVAFLAIGLWFFFVNQKIPLEELLIMAFLFQRSASKIGDLQRSYQNIAVCREYYVGLIGKMSEAEAAAESMKGAIEATLNSAIRFGNVSFGYDDNNVLDSLSFEIPAGKLTTLFGPSGSGKTTAIDLLLGFYDADSGEISIDGQSISKIKLRDWRQKVGYVPQELFLFHDSILHNLTLGDDKFTRQDAETALRRAGAWDFVAQHPQGLDAIVGERGARLSGGQRQRIAIARALIRKPRLLILDEPTTALDPQTELDICLTLKNLGSEVTIVAISHQAVLADMADNLVQLSGGHVDQAPSSSETAE